MDPIFLILGFSFAMIFLIPFLTSAFTFIGTKLEIFKKYIYKKIRNKKIKKDAFKDFEELNREINVEYSPAILSYLMDQNIEPQKDIIATLLNLYAKKIIKIERINNKYIFISNKQDKEKLSLEEKYVYWHFVDNITLEETIEYSPQVLKYISKNKSEKDIEILVDLCKKNIIQVIKIKNSIVFEPGNNKEYILTKDERYVYYYFVKIKNLKKITWLECVEYVYNKLGFRKINNKFFYKVRIFINLLIIVMINFCISLCLKEWFINLCPEIEYRGLMYFIALCLCVLPCVMMIRIYLSIQKVFKNGDVLLTTKGKQEIQKWLRFEKFIRDYTLIEERKPEDIELFRQYIPYAMALNINQEYDIKLLKDYELEEVINAIMQSQQFDYDELKNDINRYFYNL